jgi:hypothetical protein
MKAGEGRRTGFERVPELLRDGRPKLAPLISARKQSAKVRKTISAATRTAHAAPLPFEKRFSRRGAQYFL